MQVLRELRFRGQPCGLARLVNHLRGLVCRLLCQLLLEVSDTAVFLGESLGLRGDLVFPFVFLAAFQLVLLYLFGQGIISVDMFLNVVTSNSDEIRELLDNLVPAVGSVFVIYLPLLVAAPAGKF